MLRAEAHRKYTKMVMKNIMPAKKRKMPQRNEHSMLKYLQNRVRLFIPRISLGYDIIVAL